MVRRLKPPAWPSVFPAIDETKRSAGQRLFAERCANCHAHLDREDLATPVNVDTTLLKLSNLVPEIAPATVAPDKVEQLKGCLADDSPILGYKFRPLTGIWATAPYLHNGSVPTLYDLPLPPSDRPKSFYVGTREFDPVKVGFKTEQSAENSFLFRAFDDQGNPIQGNLNSGHDYNNAGLSAADREALVEYMKGL
jgi:hypothetical protein